MSDAWRDFGERLRELSSTGILIQDSPWASPEIHKAYISVNFEYDEYMKETVFPVFTESFMFRKINDSRIAGFEDFLEVFSEFYNDILSAAGVITRSGFMEGAFASPMVSGLVIEVGDDPYDADLLKIQKYGDVNFNLVSQIASQYGFMIDRNIPWRLVADLSSAAMQEYMVGVPIVGIDGDFKNQLDECRNVMRNNPAYIPDFFGYSQIPGFQDVRRHISGFIDQEGELRPGYAMYQQVREATSQQESAAIVFRAAFEETWKTDMQYLSPYFLKIYNSYVEAYPTTSRYIPPSLTEDGCPVGRTVTLERKPVTTSTIAGTSSEYGNRWSYKTFYNVRTSERRKNYSLDQDIINLREATNIYDFSSGSAAARYIQTLRLIQNNFLGPLVREFLNLYHLSDTIDPEPTDTRY